MTVTRLGRFDLSHAIVTVSVDESRSLGPHPTHTALFTGYAFSELNLYDCLFKTSEDIVAVGDNGFSLINLTSSQIEKLPGTSHDILAAKIPAGGFGFVAQVFSILGAGVSYPSRKFLLIDSL